MNLVDRAKNILLQPKQEWAVIDAESTDVKTLYTSYIAILAAIPAVAEFIGYTLIGASMPFYGTWRPPIASGVAHMIVTYVLSLAACYVVALIIDALAPNFGGRKNFIQALKVAAYSNTAGWLTGIFLLVPALTVLRVLGLYGIYLLYTGLPVLMKSPQDKSLVYTVVVIICAVVLAYLVVLLSGLLLVGPALPVLHP